MVTNEKITKTAIRKFVNTIPKQSGLVHIAYGLEIRWDSYNGYSCKGEKFSTKKDLLEYLLD